MEPYVSHLYLCCIFCLAHHKYSDGRYVASCAVHSMPVEAFIEPAEQKDTRVRGCVVSIAKDNSIALISVDSMTW